MVILQKGGKLVYKKWNAKKQEYTLKPIGKYETSYFLMDTCTLGEGIKLKDVFKFVEKNIELFRILMPNVYLNEYIKESKKKPTNKSEIRYLELYCYLTSEYGFFQGLNFPEFHGIGSTPEMGDNTPFSLSFCEISSLINLEIIMKNKISIDGEDMETLLELKNAPSFTLFQIIYGIFYELSWYGSPEKTKKHNEELQKIFKKFNKK
jgi:hypothetical protein